MHRRKFLRWPPNFKSHEFDCIDRGGYFGKKGSVYRKIKGRPKRNAKRLAWLTLQYARDRWGKMKIKSAWRPLEYNRKVGSKDTSQHLYPKKSAAVDIATVRGMTPDEMASDLRRWMREGEIPKGGVGVYSWGVHIDSRGVIRSWRGS